MAGELSAALEREHQEIDRGIEDYTRAGPDGDGTTALRAAMAALRRHIYLEEQFIFPTLRSAGMMPPVFVMLREHGEIWRAMQSVEKALADDPGGGAVRPLCDELLGRLAQHNAKEEPIIYPQADALLGPEAQRDLLAFLDSGEMPDSWVCEKA